MGLLAWGRGFDVLSVKNIFYFLIWHGTVENV